MIKRIKIQNFRSIISTDVEFKELTVFVGANGSGKSNLIKSLEFLGNVAEVGLSKAALKSGGIDSIFPKKLNKTQLRFSDIVFEYDLSLGYPSSRFPKAHSEILSNHKLVISKIGSTVPKVKYEKLSFSDPFVHSFVNKELKNNANIDDSKDSCEEIQIPDHLYDSSISFERKQSWKKDRVTVYPKTLIKKSFSDIADWFGLKNKFKFTCMSDVNSLFNANSVKTGERSLLENVFINYIWMYPGRHVAIMDSMKRFDFDQSILRYEHKVSRADTLEKNGENLPSVIHFLKTKKKKSWKNILSTISILNPLIEDVIVSQTKTGKEFIEFKENGFHRPVESWNSSDGTLRSLVTLVALETHPSEQCILIEEPEQNLHPWGAKALIDHIRETITVRNIQVILTTHSKQILEAIDPSELRIVSNCSEFGTTVNTLDELFPNNTIETCDLGRMWEKGALAGVPSCERESC